MYISFQISKLKRGVRGMDNKIIVVLLIAAILISVFSLVVTLSLNTEDLRLQEKSTTIIKQADVGSGQVGFTVGSTSKNQNE